MHAVERLEQVELTAQLLRDITHDGSRDGRQLSGRTGSGSARQLSATIVPYRMLLGTLRKETDCEGPHRAVQALHKVGSASKLVHQSSAAQRAELAF
eukprot:scaffold74618_cov67-Phaeocystis_antarctica.AAC.2